ncbi:MAG: amidase family protein, partial [Pseudomonadota bacterium]
ELAFGITSANRAFGAVANAHDPLRFAGGSSGGTAAAIAGAFTVAGLGTDTGGSSRIPAALNGIVGFRPTMGRYPADGITRISSTRDTVGPMGLTVADVEVIDRVLSGDAEFTDRVETGNLRLGVPRVYFYENLQPDIADAANGLLSTLAQHGITLVEANLPSIAELNSNVGFPVVIYESRKLLDAYLREHNLRGSLIDLVDAIASPDVKALMQNVIDPGVPQAVYDEALAVHRPALQQLYRDYFSTHRVDAMIFPTTPLTARPIASSDETVELNGERVPTFLTFIRNTDPGSNAGIPGLSIPLGKTDSGLPFGIEIDGPAGSDQKLLAIGALLESLIAGDAEHSARAN